MQNNGDKKYLVFEWQDLVIGKAIGGKMVKNMVYVEAEIQSVNNIRKITRILAKWLFMNYRTISLFVSKSDSTKHQTNEK